MSEPTFSSKLDEWLSLFPVNDMEREVEQLRTRVEQIADQIERLQSEYGLAVIQLAKAEQALAFRQRVTDQEAGVRPPQIRRKRGMTAVMAIFREAPPGMEMRAEDVRSVMIERGWMEPHEDNHSIQVALSRLTRDGKLERARYGVYRLPVSEEASTPTDVQGENGDGSEGSGDLRVVSEGLPLALEGAPDEAHRAGG